MSPNINCGWENDHCTLTMIIVASPFNTIFGCLFMQLSAYMPFWKFPFHFIHESVDGTEILPVGPIANIRSMLPSVRPYDYRTLEDAKWLSIAITRRGCQLLNNDLRFEFFLCNNNTTALSTLQRSASQYTTPCTRYTPESRKINHLQ